MKQPSQIPPSQVRPNFIPPWEAALLAELQAVDVRLLTVYAIYDVLDRDCTAAKIHRTLEKIYDAFAPSRSTCERMLQAVREADARHNPALSQPARG